MGRRHRPSLRGAQVVMRRLLWLAAFAFGLGVALPTWAQSPGSFSTLSTTGTATLDGDVLMCSGRPWIDVRCNGAVGDGSHDDTTAINAPISTDYASQAPRGFRLVSRGATIDGRAIASGPVLEIQCSGGSPTSPTG